jgi:hypothetical protein
MTTRIKDGGPAFPTTHDRTEIIRSSSGETLDKSSWSEANGGMSLRDYFAAKAMQGLMSQVTGEDVYSPPMVDTDFAPVAEPEMGKSYWYKVRDRSFFHPLTRVPDSDSGYDPNPHLLVTTHEQRLAREAFLLADAMIAAREVPNA